MSFDQLLAILQDGQRMREEDAASQPAACPHDGEPLTAGADGQLACRFDGYRP
jgi:hypothetical protein